MKKTYYFTNQTWNPGVNKPKSIDLTEKEAEGRTDIVADPKCLLPDDHFAKKPLPEKKVEKKVTKKAVKKVAKKTKE